MLPVLALALDEDVSHTDVILRPQLYRYCQRGDPLNAVTMMKWVLLAVFQGGCIMLTGAWLFADSVKSIVSITFTALIFSELLNVVLVVHTWHWVMVASEFLSVVMFVASTQILTSYFDNDLIYSFAFLWKVAVITAISWLPPAISTIFSRKSQKAEYE
jgi:phospholipid-translocating ATPase